MAKAGGGETSRRNTRGRDVADNQFGGGGGGGGGSATERLRSDVRRLLADRNSVPGGIGAATRRANQAGLSFDDIRRVLESI